MLKKIFFYINLIIIFIILIIILFILSNIVNKENTNIANSANVISTYNNPIIPEGFKKVETDSASWKLEYGIPKGWNNGLVIEDEIGNQFVWVPAVEITNEELLKIYNYDMQDQQQKEEQLKRYDEQINKYGGFYIARYEAGVTDDMQKNVKEFSSVTNDIQGIPVSKQGQIVWNYISLKNAKLNATKMYKDEHIESDLMSPIQWLALVQWCENCGYDIIDASEWGNFSNVMFRFTGYYSINRGVTYQYGENKLKSQYNMILSSGSSERNKANNIYELAGNVREYTDGWVRDRGYYSAGGHYDNLGTYIYNLSLIGVSPLEKLGYRVVLYFK